MIPHMISVDVAELKQEYVFQATPGFIFTPGNEWRIAAPEGMEYQDMKHQLHRWGLFTRFPVVTILYSAPQKGPMLASVSGWLKHDDIHVAVAVYFGGFEKMVKMTTEMARLPEEALALNIADGRSFYVVPGHYIQKALDSPIYYVSPTIQ